MSKSGCHFSPRARRKAASLRTARPRCDTAFFSSGDISAKVGRKDLASLIRDNRVNHVCAADYTEGSEIDRLVKLMIDKIAVDFELPQPETPR